MADENKEAADYVLKYVGAEVDDILTNAKELKKLDDSTSRVQAGCATISATYKEQDYTKAVNFSRAFGDAPNIMLMPVTRENKTVGIDMMSFDKSGFKIKLTSNDNNSVTDVYWVASEQKIKS